MSIGVNVTDEDLQAIRILYKVRWSAEITNWKERDTDYCLWKVACPDTTGHILVETGQSLAETINRLLERALDESSINRKYGE